MWFGFRSNADVTPAAARVRTSEKLVAYRGLNPRVRQSGGQPDQLADAVAESMSLTTLTTIRKAIVGNP
jgi:hypothetical protein